ncbi:MAG: UDP-N-acetylmuramoyl-tripeptide--D-alanyl-D-alanine ligase [Patescibacteria group bacterium]|nr:UDP-N-acetylmuramoyl-tripeptide--D-alanyl-D-alanine ligase [Patescibacteria group bacterium]
MIKNLLSRYNFHYPKILVYMLQASEYNIRDYFIWHWRVKNFKRVEQRKHFVKTAKSLLLLAAAWLIIISIIGFAVYFLWLGALNKILFFLIIFIVPYILAYIIIIPLLIIKLIQWPIEYVIIYKARQRLKNHKAVKIAIAGSFGKTTMREILKTILSEGRKTAAPSLNYNTPIGISRFIKTLADDEEVLIFELGEYYPGDIKKLCNLVQPDMGIITGINEAHLQKFKKIERTIKTIYELADFLGDKPLYVNGENELAKNNAQSKHIIYSREGVGKLKIINQKTDLSGTSFVITNGNIEVELKTNLLGLHQIGPIAAAIDIALKIGLSFEQIKNGVSKIKSFNHRLELKTDSAGIITLDDTYNGNPDGVNAVIEFLAGLKNCRRFYVTPGLVEMGIKTEEVHKQIGKKLAEANIEKIILIKNSVTSYIEQGLRENNYKGEIVRFDDALSAFAALPHLTVKGDIVLLQNDWPDQYQ